MPSILEIATPILIPLRPLPADRRPLLDFAGEVSTWLKNLSETETSPQEALMWHASWHRPGMPLRGAEHLATRISVVPDEEFGGVTGHIRGRWVQVMRVGRHWIVEVCHESHDWPRRVFWGAAEDWPGKHTRTGQPWAVEYFSSLQAAVVAWSWMRKGSLPEGISHTSDYYHPRG